MLLRQGVFAVLICLPALAQVTNVTASPASAEKVGRYHYPITDRHDHEDGTSDSTNWSGYAVLGSSFTSASGSWVVPTATCTGVSGDQYSSFWVGLDGYSSNTVEQTGTDSDCDGTSPSYYAWYEFYPEPSYEITSVPVSPGNVISASVTYSGNEFTITITNTNTGKSYSKTSTVRGAQRSSAEWITEAPCCTSRNGILPLSDFGTVLFGDDSTRVTGTNDATDRSQSGAIGSFPSADIELIQKVGSSSSPQTSTCSALSSDGTSFTCTWAQ